MESSTAALILRRPLEGKSGRKGYRKEKRPGSNFKQQLFRSTFPRLTARARFTLDPCCPFVPLRRYVLLMY